VTQITAAARVPAYSAIVTGSATGSTRSATPVPVIGVEPLFGGRLTEQEAEAQAGHGKHHPGALRELPHPARQRHLLRPDHTKTWLDPSWGSKKCGEQQMAGVS
jgi:hypothetical protein